MKFTIRKSEFSNTSYTILRRISQIFKGWHPGFRRAAYECNLRTCTVYLFSNECVERVLSICNRSFSNMKDVWK